MPSKSARAAAKRGLAARRQAVPSKRGGLTTAQAGAQGIGSGVARARDIAEGQRVDAYRVLSFFARHRGNYLKAKEKGLAAHDSKAIQAWLLWGGDPMYRQAQRAVARHRSQTESPRKALARYMRDKYGV